MGILFLKILIWLYNFFIFFYIFYILYSTHVSVDIIRVFFLILLFQTESLKSQQKLLKKITLFTTQCRTKNLTNFMNLNSLGIESSMLTQDSQKLFWLYNFSSKYVSVWCQKKHFCCAISWRPKTAFWKYFESKCLYISVHLCKNIFVPETK